MFNVFCDGVYLSTHKTLPKACRHARKQATHHRNAYFTVFEVDDEMSHTFEAGSDTLWGLPEYIIVPQESAAEVAIRNAIPLTEASLLLRTRSPAPMGYLAEYPLI
ncbi:MAG: hypothetical protein RI964_857 [Pseudomonadota bacterium]|jgi:hypothetical protein